MITATIRGENNLKATDQVCAESRVVKKSLHFLDWRDNMSVEILKTASWFDEWVKNGKLEKRYFATVKVCCPATTTVNEIDIYGIGDILSLMQKYGKMEIRLPKYDEYEMDIKIGVDRPYKK